MDQQQLAALASALSGPSMDKRGQNAQGGFWRGVGRGITGGVRAIGRGIGNTLRESVPGQFVTGWREGGFRQGARDAWHATPAYRGFDMVRDIFTGDAPPGGFVSPSREQPSQVFAGARDPIIDLAQAITGRDRLNEPTTTRAGSGGDVGRSGDAGFRTGPGAMRGGQPGGTVRDVDVLALASGAGSYTGGGLGRMGIVGGLWGPNRELGGRHIEAR